MKEEEAAKCNPKETPLARSIDKMEISVHNEMKMLFNKAHHVALHEMPFTAFPGLCALQKKNGLHEIGKTSSEHTDRMTALPSLHTYTWLG